MQSSLAVLARGPTRGPAAEEAPGGPAVVRLAVSEFRCYRSAVVEIDPQGPRPVVLTGPNGAGKTNLLEALSFLAPGRGLRGARLGAVDRLLPGRDGQAGGHASGSWAVAAKIRRGADIVEVGTGRDPVIEPAAGRGRRIVKIDGTFGSQAGLADVAAISWLTPQMDRLFLDAAGERRRFLDRLVFCFDPAHAARVSAYEQAMRERMRLLRDRPGMRSGTPRTTGSGDRGRNPAVPASTANGRGGASGWRGSP